MIVMLINFNILAGHREAKRRRNKGFIDSANQHNH